MAEINKRGNTIIRSSDLGSDRYKYDLEICKSADGWTQYDTNQDAWYFGVWVHPKTRQILTYAEGDVSVVHCKSEKSYHEELKNMAEFYGDPPWASKAYGLDGTVTEFYDERPI